MKFEQDEVAIIGGVRHGLTLGGPVAIRVGNTEWPKWEKVMAADPVDRGRLAALARNAAADPAPARPRRPGRACRSTASTRPGRSWSGPPPGRPRPASRSARSPRSSSSRPSASELVSHVVAIGTGRGAEPASVPTPDDVGRPRRRPGALPRPRRQHGDGRRDRRRPTRTATPSAASSRCSRTACPPGLGTHVHWDRRLDARLAGALMGIQAIKGVEVGDGFDRGPPRLAGPRRDRAATADGRSAARPAAPAASRAACRRASRCGCGPR